MIENLYGEAPPPTGTDTPGDLSVVAVLANLAGPYAIRAAVTLQLPDLIAAGTTRVSDLAEASGADADMLGRLLRFLAVRGVFRETDPDVFTMTESAKVLTSDHPAGIRGWFDLNGPAASRMDACWTGLLDTVRTGEPAYTRIFGKPVWEDLDDHPAQGAAFGGLMAGRAASFIPEVVAAYQWPETGHVVDVAGGAGGLLAEVLARHPGATGTLVDLPAVTPLARERFAAAGLADRSTVVDGSIMQPLPAGGDVYVLASILHDWPDDVSTTILRRCAEALAPGGRVLVVDRVREYGNQLTFTFMDLLLPVFCGGKERSTAEFSSLGQGVGLALTATTPVPTGLSLLTFQKPA